MSEKVISKPGNGVEKEKVITAATVTETGVIDEVERVIERGEARAISLENIEKGLTALWQAAAKPRPGEEEQLVMRACVFNLVICVKTDDQLSDVTDTIAELTWGYPCRAIVLLHKPEEPTSEVSASISAHCQLPTGTGKKVCCEQITVVGTGEAADGIWSLVLPLLVPDLPVILWWPDDPCVESNLFERLLDTADRLIVDSRVFIDPSRTFAQLADFAKSDYNEVAFSDLSWTRLTPWRSMLAQFFDNRDYVQYLFDIERVDIHYEAPDDNQNPNFSEALLLLGWLSHQLGWQPAFKIQRKGSNATLILNRHGVPLTVVMHGHNDRVDDLGGITQIKLLASKPGPDGSEIHASFTITLTEDYEKAMAFIEEDDRPLVSRTVLFPKRSRTELLSEDLTIVRRDTMYEAALELAGHFNQ